MKTSKKSFFWGSYVPVDHKFWRLEAERLEAERLEAERREAERREAEPWYKKIWNR